MTRRKRLKPAAPSSAVPHVPANTGWIVSDVYTMPNGKTLTLGTEVTVRGERGARFRFYSHTRTPDGREWLDCMGGPVKVTMWRSFRPDRISRVFRVAKTKATAALS
jgi:hypothetical protein